MVDQSNDQLSTYSSPASVEVAICCGTGVGGEAPNPTCVACISAGRPRPCCLHRTATVTLLSVADWPALLVVAALAHASAARTSLSPPLQLPPPMQRPPMQLPPPPPQHRCHREWNQHPQDQPPPPPPPPPEQLQGLGYRRDQQVPLQPQWLLQLQSPRWRRLRRRRLRLQEQGSQRRRLWRKRRLWLLCGRAGPSERAGGAGSASFLKDMQGGHVLSAQRNQIAAPPRNCNFTSTAAGGEFPGGDVTGQGRRGGQRWRGREVAEGGNLAGKQHGA